MKLEPTFRDPEAVLRISGPGRLGSATFLSVWLTVWVIGEGLVLWLLIRGGWSLLTGQPPGAGRAPLDPAPALACGLFLLGWLAFWTLGGVLAGQELLRLLFGRDRFIVRPDEVEIEHGYGLFRTRQLLPRPHLRRFYLSPARQALAAETTGGAMDLSHLGSAGERGALVAALNAELGLSSVPSSDGVLPEEWRELISPEGLPILVKNPATRRKQAAIMQGIFLTLALPGAYILYETVGRPSLGVFAVLVTLFAALAGWGAYRLTWCRDEWILGSGRLTLQRRTRSRAVTRFEACGLQLLEDKDSDGDPWYRLVAAQEVPCALHNRNSWRAISSASGDPTGLRSMGCWLARRAALPFLDRTTTEAKAEEYERLKQQLAASGRLGAWAARLLDKVRPKPR